MRRAFVASGLAHASVHAALDLDDDVRHRLITVLRLADGDHVELFDDDGRVVRGALHGASVIVDSIDVKDDALPPLLVLQAITKTDKLELVVQKATELGASQIVLFQARRSQVQLGGKYPKGDDDRAQGKVDRLQRIANDAARQCGRVRPPTVLGPMKLDAALTHAHGMLAVAGVVDAEHTLSATLRTEQASLARGFAVVIGPEGGLDDDEQRMLRDAGVRPVRWSRFVLRTETAALSALSIAQAALGEA